MDTRGASSFLTTRWSVVLDAGGVPSEARTVALEELARGYWYPLYAFARRRGEAAEIAADRVQSFFALLLERGDFSRADPERGRFRAFLVTAFKNHLQDEREKARTMKRGGNRVVFSIDTGAAEARLAVEPAVFETPEHAFERAWVAELLARTFATLREEQARIGRARVFDLLRPALAGEDDAPRFASVAHELGMTENAVKVAAHRLRRRFGELLRDEIAGTLDTPGDPAAVQAELEALFRSASRHA